VTLEKRAAGVAATLLTRALPEWLAGRLEARQQPRDGVTLTRPLRRKDGLLDPTRSAVELERQVRAYQPWPGSYIEIAPGRLIVWQAGVEPRQPRDAQGELVATRRDGIGLVVSDGVLVLEEVQLAGKRRVSAAEFRRGYPSLTQVGPGADRSDMR
jgi:methionyl-tRNA formyltransferase